jgi:hypothetical protein
LIAPRQDRDWNALLRRGRLCFHDTSGMALRQRAAFRGHATPPGLVLLLRSFGVVRRIFVVWLFSVSHLAFDEYLGILPGKFRGLKKYLSGPRVWVPKRLITLFRKF